MSAEFGPQSRSSVVLHAGPASAALVEGAFDAWLARRCASAREAGVLEGEVRAQRRAAQALDAACAQLESASQRAAEELTHSAVQLVLEIARVVLRRELDAGHYDLERIVRETLAFANVGRGSCVVHLNPADAAALADIRFRQGTTIEADADVARGDVHVTTPRGLLVREIDEALRAIGERIQGDLA